MCLPTPKAGQYYRQEFAHFPFNSVPCMNILWKNGRPNRGYRLTGKTQQLFKFYSSSLSQLTLQHFTLPS